jgi:CHAT domain-containing protein/tetratricopeptide (TPR) repeat protein
VGTHPMKSAGAEFSWFPEMGFGGFFLTVLICLFGAAPAKAAANATYDQVTLVGGNPISLHLVPGSVSSVGVEFGRTVAEEILLQTAAPNVSYRILSEDGVQIQSGRASAAGWLAIPLTAAGEKRVQLLLTVDRAQVELPVAWARLETIAIPLNKLRKCARAAQLNSDAQALHMSESAQDVRQAIAKYRDAAAEWAEAEDLYGEAVALGGEAESQFELGHYAGAAQTLERAIRLNGKNNYLNSWLGHIEARSFLDEWETESAQRYIEESLRLANKIDEPALIAEARADRAEVGFLTRDKAAAKDAEESLSAARLEGLPETAAYSLRTMAWIEEDLGHLSRALSLMDEAEAYFRLAGDLRRSLESIEDFTTIKRLTGDDYAALTRYTELEPLTSRLGNPVVYGLLLENIGDVYANLNRKQLASNYYWRADRVFADVGFRSGESMVRGRMCMVDLGFHDLQNALNDCLRAEGIARSMGDRKRIAIAQYRLGMVYQESGEHAKLSRDTANEWKELERALQQFQDAVNASVSINDKRWEAQERLNLGEVLQELGRNEDALEEFMTARDRSQDSEDSAGLLEAQYRVARWYAEDGQYEAAMAELKPALEQIEVFRKKVSNSTLQASYFAAQRKCYELGVELLMREKGPDASSKSDARALEMSEEGRARGLLDALNARAAPVMRLREEAKAGLALPNLAQSNLAVDQAFDQRLKLLLERGGKRELDTNAAKLTMALGMLERTEDESHSAANFIDSSAQTVTTAEIESASRSSGATYLEFALGPAHSYLWVIDGGALKSYVLPPRDQIDAMVKRWRELINSDAIVSRQQNSEEHGPGNPSPDFHRFSARISCVLLGKALKANMMQLVIVPDGDLAMLPFAALPENGCSSRQGGPLIATHEIMLTPSLSVFLSRNPAAERKPFKGEVAVIADPVFDPSDQRARGLKRSRLSQTKSSTSSRAASVALPRLLNTQSEADSILREAQKAGRNQVFVATGLKASLQTVLSPAMQDYRIWHLATHGVYDDTEPEFSGLVFSLVGQDGAPVLGFLKAHDIANLNLRPELVVLSACNSASGENLSGEGIMGLSYSFLRAGAKEVVATLWDIDDATSKDLMAAFYREMIRNGNDAAKALRKSQLAAMKSHRGFSTYDWAGFELTSVGK